MVEEKRKIRERYETEKSKGSFDRHQGACARSVSLHL